MPISSQLTDDAVLAELGERLARARLDLNLSQRELEERAGVSRSAIQAAEKGRSVSLTTLVRLLRGLGLLDALDRLVPEPRVSPIQQLRMQGRQRRRASAAGADASGDEPRPWRWGDETEARGR